jgi:GDPmannose 4,6-dehydratase
VARKAVIVGAGGQDGRCLEIFLRSLGRHELTSIERHATRQADGSGGPQVDITNPSEVLSLVQAVQPDEIYHLAAFHHSAQESLVEDLSFYRRSYEVNLFSLLNFLEAIRLCCPTARLFYAGSSHVFGQVEAGSSSELQNEETPFRPQSVYAMTKVDGILACRAYRTRHRVFASAGILFNHESPFRRPSFLSRKVTRAAVAIQRGSPEKLVLADLDAEVDWGYAPDYVEAMHAILACPTADEFVVATGQRHTVRDLVEAAFREVGLDWTQHVQENPKILGRRRQASIGDASKLMRETDWKPKTPFLEMIRILVREEMQRLE